MSGSRADSNVAGGATVAGESVGDGPDAVLVAVCADEGPRAGAGVVATGSAVGVFGVVAVDVGDAATGVSEARSETVGVNPGG